MSSYVTATDLFCGAGGSSTGLVEAGVEVIRAANHWQLAIDTHTTNHPNTTHDCADIRQTHPSLLPKTTILWASPECTSHSLAKGKKRKAANQLDLWGETALTPDEIRSRATMREVVEFSEYHRYDIVIVENVVDIRYWEYYDDWLQSMHNLGYDHKALYLNAQFFGVPQSRDRVYVVFWKKGNRAPNLDFRPPAACPNHGLIHAVQWWKKPGFPWGRYGARRQYIYRCPKCGEEVTPAHVPAATVIDWTLPAPLIGDRAKPLKPKTMERIKAGLRKFARPVPVVVDTSYNHANHNGKVFPLDSALPTQTSQQSQALMIPPFLAVMKAELDGISIDEPLTTIVASATQHWLVMPFLASLNHSDNRLNDVGAALPTVMPHATPSLVVPFMLSYYNNASDPRGANEPMYTVAGRNTPALVIPPFLTQYYSREDAQSGINEPMPVIPSENRHAVVIPPFIAPLRNNTAPYTVDGPLGTITAGAQHHALVMSYYGGNPVFAEPSEPMPGITTVQRHALIEVDEIVEQCGFRMLEPEELKRGMSFPNDYIVLGNKRHQVKQIGNAVCVNVARWIAERCVESLR